MFLAVVGFNNNSGAQQRLDKIVYNPHPSPGDIDLPLPGGLKMIFRKVVVPGSGFWGETERSMLIGNVNGGIYEGPQKVQINGSFKDRSNWFYYLGKYEVSWAQFASVMGSGDIIRGLTNTAKSINTTNPTKGLQLLFSSNRKIKKLRALSQLRFAMLKKELSKPAANISWQNVQEFLRLYNLWLFKKHKANPKILPVKIWFIRLPTEFEWEYAVRGGRKAQLKRTFERDNPLPPNSSWAQYSWSSENAKNKVRRIGGNRKPIHGFYDLFGNVQELVSGRFHPEIWQGKPGGRVVRGGSVSHSNRKFRSSLRSEFPQYNWKSKLKMLVEYRAFHTGIRIALGSNVLVNRKDKAELEREYIRYKTEIRASLPVGQALQAGSLQALSSIRGAAETIDRLISQNPTFRSSLGPLKSQIEKADRKIHEELQFSALATVREVAWRAAALSRHFPRVNVLKQSIKRTQRVLSTSTRFQPRMRQMKLALSDTKALIKTDASSYIRKLKRFTNLGEAYCKYALGQLKQEMTSRAQKKRFKLIKKHYTQFRQGQIDLKEIQVDLRRTFTRSI